jgi:hypothetical protein
MSLSIVQVVFDCDNAERLAGFWSEVLERPVDDGAAPFFATIGRGGAGLTLMFIKVPESKQVKNRLHLDLHGSDGQDGPAEVQRVIGLGAKQVSEHREYGLHWVTLSDPEGNEFDVAIGPDPASAQAPA